LITGILTNIRFSAFTFKRGTAEKASFILLNQLDLILTIWAMHLGLNELNPFIQPLLAMPAMLLLVKLLIPVIIAWAVPGRFLWPMLALLALVLSWNLKELLLFLL